MSAHTPNTAQKTVSASNLNYSTDIYTERSLHTEWLVLTKTLSILYTYTYKYTCTCFLIHYVNTIIYHLLQRIRDPGNYNIRIRREKKLAHIIRVHELSCSDDANVKRPPRTARAQIDRAFSSVAEDAAKSLLLGRRGRSEKSCWACVTTRIYKSITPGALLGNNASPLVLTKIVRICVSAICFNNTS